MFECIGSCLTVFNDEGKCISPDLPWPNEETFQAAEEEMSIPICENDFYKLCPYDPFIEDEIEGHEVEYLEVDGIHMIYDANTNRHYFFA